jgi:hypothetical protein
MTDGSSVLKTKEASVTHDVLSFNGAKTLASLDVDITFSLKKIELLLYS